jgi:Family of unknown function (DUF6062)
MHAIEFEHWRDNLGTATMYESVLQRNLAGLNEFVERTRRQIEAQHPPSAHWLSRLRIHLRRTLDGASPKLSPGLTPQARCRVCEQGEKSAGWFVQTLAQKLEWEQFREWYRQSDGLCLPHLNHLLAGVADAQRRAWLADVAVEKFEANARDLGKALGRSNHRFHEELAAGSEGKAYRRAVEQFKGNDG